MALQPPSPSTPTSSKTDSKAFSYVEEREDFGGDRWNGQQHRSSLLGPSADRVSLHSSSYASKESLVDVCVPDKISQHLMVLDGTETQQQQAASPAHQQESAAPSAVAFSPTSHETFTSLNSATAPQPGIMDSHNLEWGSLPPGDNPEAHKGSPDLLQWSSSALLIDPDHPLDITPDDGSYGPPNMGIHLSDISTPDIANASGVSDQHFRTKLCPFLFGTRGECAKRHECSYAHSMSELRNRPDLTKTKLCDAYMKGRCQDPACKWAHGRHELRFTGDFYKTSLCKYWVESVCYAGATCRHAHGDAELRARRPGPRNLSLTTSSASTSPAFGSASVLSSQADTTRALELTSAAESNGVSPLAPQLAEADFTSRTTGPGIVASSVTSPFSTSGAAETGFGHPSLLPSALAHLRARSVVPSSVSSSSIIPVAAPPISGTFSELNSTIPSAAPSDTHSALLLLSTESSPTTLGVNSGATFSSTSGSPPAASNDDSRTAYSPVIETQDTTVSSAPWGATIKDPFMTVVFHQTNDDSSSIPGQHTPSIEPSHLIPRSVVCERPGLGESELTSRKTSLCPEYNPSLDPDVYSIDGGATEEELALTGSPYPITLLKEFLQNRRSTSATMSTEVGSIPTSVLLNDWSSGSGYAYPSTASPGTPFSVEAQLTTGQRGLFFGRGSQVSVSSSTGRPGDVGLLYERLPGNQLLAPSSGDTEADFRRLSCSATVASRNLRNSLDATVALQQNNRRATEEISRRLFENQTVCYRPDTRTRYPPLGLQFDAPQETTSPVTSLPSLSSPSAPGDSQTEASALLALSALLPSESTPSSAVSWRITTNRSGSPTRWRGDHQQSIEELPSRAAASVVQGPQLHLDGKKSNTVTFSTDAYSGIQNSSSVDGNSSTWINPALLNSPFSLPANFSSISYNVGTSPESVSSDPKVESDAVAVTDTETIVRALSQSLLGEGSWGGSSTEYDNISCPGRSVTKNVSHHPDASPLLFSQNTAVSSQDPATQPPSLFEMILARSLTYTGDAENNSHTNNIIRRLRTQTAGGSSGSHQFIFREALPPVHNHPRSRTAGDNLLNSRDLLKILCLNESDSADNFFSYLTCAPSEALSALSSSARVPQHASSGSNSTVILSGREASRVPPHQMSDKADSPTVDSSVFPGGATTIASCDVTSSSSSPRPSPGCPTATTMTAPAGLTPFRSADHIMSSSSDSEDVTSPSHSHRRTVSSFISPAIKYLEPSADRDTSTGSNTHF